ncbi:hypothetical protein [uncultured Aquitalea sp.]|uniref:hypothetical protein n=1 Tax=uncultured Aquitalea sp. TaxID=540272 RepID=UPI0025FEDFCC|nr:hypothetical protein [uncultured Aquitalea sp.]
MVVQIELGQLVIAAGSMLAAMAGGMFGIAKLLGSQIETRLDEKFQAQEQARETSDKTLKESIERYAGKSEETAQQVMELERNFLKWQAEIPVHYVRREDYIRGQSVIEAKLDALYSKVEVVQLQGASNVR